MARRVVSSAQSPGGELAESVMKSYPTVRGQPDDLVLAPYNPRTIDDDQLDALCYSISEFGFVDPVIARQEDRLVLGGHQRLLAVRRLLAGEYRRRGEDGKSRVVPFSLPADGIPIVYIPSLSDEKAKLLNLALNRISGDWEHEKLAHMFKDLSLNADLDLSVTGFSVPEITDYVDLLDASAGGDSGDMPMPSTKAPSLALDFSSKELRDAVKSAIAATSQNESALSGDLLAKMLDVKPKRKRA